MLLPPAYLPVMTWLTPVKTATTTAAAAAAVQLK
jgi:hypothetical protein